MKHQKDILKTRKMLSMKSHLHFHNKNTSASKMKPDPTKRNWWWEFESGVNYRIFAGEHVNSLSCHCMSCNVHLLLVVNVRRHWLCLWLLYSETDTLKKRPQKYGVINEQKNFYFFFKERGKLHFLTLLLFQNLLFFCPAIPLDLLELLLLL